MMQKPILLTPIILTIQSLYMIHSHIANWWPQPTDGFQYTEALTYSKTHLRRYYFRVYSMWTCTRGKNFCQAEQPIGWHGKQSASSTVYIQPGVALPTSYTPTSTSGPTTCKIWRCEIHQQVKGDNLVMENKKYTTATCRVSDGHHH